MQQDVDDNFAQPIRRAGAHQKIGRRLTDRATSSVDQCAIFLSSTDFWSNKMIPDGLITMPSAYSVAETIDRAQSTLAARGITVFARIDHAAGAHAVALQLRPTEVLIFGNPAAGTPLMQAVPLIALDLPLRFLAYENEDGETRLAFYSPEYLAKHHGLEPQVTAKMTLQITQLASEVTGGK